MIRKRVFEVAGVGRIAVVFNASNEHQNKMP